MLAPGAAWRKTPGARCMLHPAPGVDLVSQRARGSVRMWCGRVRHGRCSCAATRGRCRGLRAGSRSAERRNRRGSRRRAATRGLLHRNLERALGRRAATGTCNLRRRWRGRHALVAASLGRATAAPADRCLRLQGRDELLEHVDELRERCDERCGRVGGAATLDGDRTSCGLRCAGRRRGATTGRGACCGLRAASGRAGRDARKRRRGGRRGRRPARRAWSRRQTRCCRGANGNSHEIRPPESVQMSRPTRLRQSLEASVQRNGSSGKARRRPSRRNERLLAAVHAGQLAGQPLSLRLQLAEHRLHRGEHAVVVDPLALEAIVHAIDA